MYLKLDRETKYNFYMRYKNGEKLNDLLNELNLYENININSIKALESMLTSAKDYEVLKVKREKLKLEKDKLEKENKLIAKRIKRRKRQEKKILEENDRIKRKIKIEKRYENIAKAIQNNFSTFEKRMRGKMKENHIKWVFYYEKNYKYDISERRMFKILGINKSSYHGWLLGGRKTETQFKKHDVEKVKWVHSHVMKRRGGVEVLHRYLIGEEGGICYMRIARKTVQRIYEHHGMKSKTRKKRNSPPKENKITGQPDKNLLGYDFDAKSPNQKWWIDESYIEMSNGEWYYLCAVIDSYNNYLVSWDISHHRDQKLAMRVLRNAIKKRGNINGLILTSDNAQIYKSHKFRKYCINNGVIQSFIENGKSTQNRPIEYFFNIYKNYYLIDLPKKQRTIKKLKDLSIEWIHLYNYKRNQDFTSYSKDLKKRVFIKRCAPADFDKS